MAIKRKEEEEEDARNCSAGLSERTKVLKEGNFSSQQRGGTRKK